MEGEPSIDVSKAQVDVQSGLRRDGSCPTTRPESRNWSPRWWIGPAMVLLEATGGLELVGGRSRCCGAAGGGGQPRQVRDFEGHRYPSDRRDAAVLAHFADAIRPEVRPLRDGRARSTR